MRIIRSNINSGCDQKNYEYNISMIRRIIEICSDDDRLAARLEPVTGIIAEEHGLPIAAVDIDIVMPQELAIRVRALRHAVAAPDWPSITALMHAYPQHIRYDPQNPSKLIFDAKAAGASESIRHTLLRYAHYASDLAAEVLHDVDPVRNQMRLATLERLRTSNQRF